MTNLQTYTLASVYVNGALLTEEASVRVGRTTNSQAVMTVAKGYAGESPGAGMTEITVENAVPSSAFEFDPGPFMGELKPVEITLFAAGSTLTFKGFIISDNFAHGVNSESKLEFQARGGFATWE